MILAEGRDSNLQHPPDQRLGLSGHPQPLVEHAELGGGRQCLRILGLGSPIQIHRTLEMIARILIPTKRDVCVGDGSTNGSLNRGLIVQFLTLGNPH